MATIPLPERRTACDGLLRVSGEDAVEGGRILNYLNIAFPGFAWTTILRERALIWQPFIDSGLSIDAWIDEVERWAAIFAGQV